MTEIKLKKLEFQQLSQKSTKKTEMGRVQMALQSRRIVGLSKIEFHWKFQELYFLISCKKNFGNAAVALGWTLITSIPL